MAVEERGVTAEAKGWQWFSERVYDEPEVPARRAMTAGELVFDIVFKNVLASVHLAYYIGI